MVCLFLVQESSFLYIPVIFFLCFWTTLKLLPSQTFFRYRKQALNCFNQKNKNCLSEMFLNVSVENSWVERTSIKCANSQSSTPLKANFITDAIFGNFWECSKLLFYTSRGVLRTLSDISLLKKCPYLEVFLSGFSLIRTEYRDLLVLFRQCL